MFLRARRVLRMRNGPVHRMIVNAMVVHWRNMFIPRRNRAVTMEFTRPRRSCNRRTPMIHRREKFAIAASAVFVVRLHPGLFEVMLMHGHFFTAAWPRVDSMRTAVEAYAVHGDIVDHRPVINVNVGDRHIADGTVVEEMPAAPFPTIETHARISEAVIHAAIKADVRSPVADMPDVCAAAPSPVAGRPEQSRTRRHDPGS